MLRIDPDHSRLLFRIHCSLLSFYLTFHSSFCTYSFICLQTSILLSQFCSDDTSFPLVTIVCFGLLVTFHAFPIFRAMAITCSHPSYFSTRSLEGLHLSLLVGICLSPFSSLPRNSFLWIIWTSVLALPFTVSLGKVFNSLIFSVPIHKIVVIK